MILNDKSIVPDWLHSCPDVCFRFPFIGVPLLSASGLPSCGLLLLMVIICLFIFYCTLNFSFITRQLLLSSPAEQYSKIRIKSERGNSCLPEKTELRMWKRGGGWIPWGRIYPGHCSGLCSCYHC